MTDISSPTADDILSDDLREEGPAQRLGKKADTLIADVEGRAFARSEGIRKAVRSDLHQGRLWARDHAEQTREVIRDHPMKTALYAIGAGVVLGLLLRR
ncbi:hypothetical protein [Brevundimonas goettingensis]|uniref:DUF883 domain-containing protein n=1 Tax=Brevundimonas goettingensis TaxID=2774190 RepID=A0A975GZD3_9CAUL|nr:hypothetical protein [Brevundimonas goettingensis]QTC92530.1 hypothetical protein IFJ75_06580 [Brevundimonas goettingensis]